MNKSYFNYLQIGVVPLLLVFIINSPVKADKKYFTTVYTSYTMPQRGFEIEVWNSAAIGKEFGNYSSWEPRVEFEYGITDRLTGSMYLNFSQAKSSGNNFDPEPFGLSTTSFELRYRLSNPNQWFVDPALYLEVGYGGDVVEYEPKILLTKQFDRFISAININSEIVRGIGNVENSSAFELTMGLAYEFSNEISAGLEFRHDRDYSNIYSNQEDQASFIGPVVSFQSDKLYFVMSFMAQFSGSTSGMNNNLDLTGHERYEFRTVLGIEL